MSKVSYSNTVSIDLIIDHWLFSILMSLQTGEFLNLSVFAIARQNDVVLFLSQFLDAIASLEIPYIQVTYLLTHFLTQC